MSYKKFNERLFINRPLIFWLVVVIVGLGLGNIIGFLAYSGVIAKEIFRSIPKICFGIIVIIIDSLCIWFIIYRQLYKSTDAKGEPTVGIIEDIFVFSNPKQLLLNEWIRDVSFCCTISYSAEGKNHRKEFPPTAYTSRQELYPITFEEGGEIKLKYHKKHPRFCIIDIDLLKQCYYAQTRRIHIISLFIIFIVTVSYIFYVLYG